MEPMEPKQMKQVEGWFRKMNERFDDTNRRLENRFTALLNVCTNTRTKLDSLDKNVENLEVVISAMREEIGEIRDELKGSKAKYERYEARLLALELALKELESRISH